MAYLALRHTAPSGFLQGIFSKLTCARLVTKYPHSGIVIDGILYHSTLSRGVHAIKFDPEGWDIFTIPAGHNTLQCRFANVKGSKYDWFSLLAFVLPFRMRVSNWFYCYEFCDYMMTGESPTKRITPERLLTGIVNNDARIGAVGMVY